MIPFLARVSLYFVISSVHCFHASALWLDSISPREHSTALRTIHKLHHILFKLILFFPQVILQDGVLTKSKQLWKELQWDFFSTRCTYLFQQNSSHKNYCNSLWNNFIFLGVIQDHWVVIRSCVYSGRRHLNTFLSLLQFSVHTFSKT